jgi:peptidoglycan hydrolase-like protein with peptidoglycan-binding domain
LERARALDPTCADRACSWGLGQVLGSNAEMLGFSSVAEMMQSLRAGRVAAQIDLMVRFIKANKLTGLLARGDWAEFARRYNGPGFKKNRYDEKLAAAYAKWAQFLTGLNGQALPEEAAATGPLASGSRGERVERLQSALKAMGYAVGEIDGLYGPATQAAVAAFQRDRGLPMSGSADEATLRSLQDKPSESDDLLRLLLDAILRPVDPGKPPRSPAPVPPILSPVDRMIGGEMLAGKKTLLAVLAYVALAIGQATGGIGTAMGAGATPTGEILTSLIAAFGGLGLISKGDRAVQMLGIIAAEHSAEPRS